MYGFGNSGNILGIIIGVLIGIIIVFLICRELVCWYWKINRLVALMEEQNDLLKNMKNNISDSSSNVAAAHEIFEGATHKLKFDRALTEKPSIFGSEILKLEKGVYVIFKEQSANTEMIGGIKAPFYLVETESGQRGWIFSDYLESI
jgi:hypothetical protein